MIRRAACIRRWLEASQTDPETTVAMETEAAFLEIVSKEDWAHEGRNAAQ